LGNIGGHPFYIVKPSFSLARALALALANNPDFNPHYIQPAILGQSQKHPPIEH
jgi:hypothetical protein